MERADSALGSESNVAPAVPSISIVIPAYNRAAVIGRALASALAQTIPAHEIIVVDDGSTDRTSDVVARFCASNPVVRLLRQANRGAGAARNRAVAAARGDWIAFLDSDDAWEPRKLENATALFTQDPRIEFVHSNVRYRYPDGSERTWNDRDPADLTDRSYLLSHFLIKAPAVMIKRSLLDRIGGLFPESISTCEDFEVWWRAVVASRRIGYVSTPDVVIYISPDSLTQAAHPTALLRDNIVARGRVRQWLIDHGAAHHYVTIMRRDQYWDYRELVRGWIRERNVRELVRDVRDCARDLSAREAARAIASASLASLRSWRHPDGQA